MAQSLFKSGFSGPQADVDKLTRFPEDNLSVPWTISNPESTFLDYRCWLECALDAGMVLHKPLPQEEYDPDTLAVIDMQSPVGDIYDEEGVNIAPNLPVVDVIQRMATSTFRFALKGWGIRVGFQVPVPFLHAVGQSTAIPDEVQWTSGQVIIANYAGIPVFSCRWELHYIVAGPIRAISPGLNGQAGLPIPFNPALHIRPDAQLPSVIKLPRTHVDQNAVPAVPTNVPARVGPGALPNLQRGQ